MRPFLFATLSASCLVACGGSERASSGDASVAQSASPLAVVEQLSRADRTLEEALAPRGNGLVRDGARITTAPRAFGDLRVTLGDKATDSIAIGTDDEHAVRLTIDGARDVVARIDGGRAHFEGALPSSDVVLGATPGRVELAVLMRDAAAASSLRLRVELPPALVRVASQNGALGFLDAKGRARLILERPYAIDANGVRREATIARDGGALEISFDPTGLTYPVLLDPGFEAQRWQEIGLYDESVGYRPRANERIRGTLSYDTHQKLLLGFGGYMRDSSKLSTPGLATGQLNAYTIGSVYTDWVARASGPDGYAQTPITSTPPLQNWGWSAAYDLDRKKLVAIGSRDEANTRLLVYEYDSVTDAWAQRCASGCTGSPPVVRDPLVAYDEVRKITVIVNRSNGATYGWNGATGAWTTYASNSVGPQAITFDSKKGRVLAVAWDGTYEWVGTWSKVSTSGSSGVMGLGFDRARGRGVLVVGKSGTTETREWDGATWFSTVDGTTGAVAPKYKMDAAMGFDAARGRMVLWGGGNGQSGASYDFGDFSAVTWQYQSWGGTCASDADCDGGSCRDGYCCAIQCGACRRCDEPGFVGQCRPYAGAAGTGTEHDTCTGTSACNVAGVCTKKNGQACSSGAECASNNCVDGVCCSTACSQNCESCNVTPGTCTPSPKGSGGRTGCGAGLCNGVDRTCSLACATDADCSSSGYCNGGTCAVNLAKGAVCTRDRMCASGSCRDGRCCDRACTGACEACSVATGASSEGTCTFLPASSAPAACLGYKCSGTSGACAAGCTSDATCASGHYCDGAFCQPVRKQGQTCTRTTQCEAGLTCADGVCCNSACDGACQACAAERKESGTASGTCGAARAGTDPGDRCPATAATTCGTTGVCGNSGTCALWAAGAACGPAGASICDGGVAKGQTCDGLGACKTDSAGTKCAPGVCKDGGCVLTCATDAECDAAAFCDSGACRDKAANGTKCGAARECVSGFCADGVCCNAACNGTCEACDGDGTAGTCTAVKGAPRTGHGECPGPSASDPCTAAACDGVDRAACKGLAGAEVSCRAGSCKSDVETVEARCNGSGACPAETTKPCDPFACGDTKCKETCSADTDCKRGNKCDVASGKCFVPTTCDGDHTLKGADGRTTDCAPFRCTDEGCRKTCASSDECVSNALCDGNQCVLRGDPPVDDGGGCAHGGSPHGAVFFLFALAALGSAARRGAR